MKKTILLFVLIVSFGLAVAQQQEKKPTGTIQQQVDTLVAEGMALNDKRDFSRALELYDKALKLDNDNLLALQQKALTLYTLGEYNQAILYCKTAIQKHPDEKELMGVYLTYGNALEAEQKQLEALKIYNQGLRLFPNSYKLYYNKGLTLWEVTDYDNAILCFQNAVMINPAHAHSHYAMGGLLYMQGKRIPALLALCTYLILEPIGVRALNILEVAELLMKERPAQKGKGIFASNTAPNTLDLNSFHSLSSLFTDTSFNSTEIALSVALGKGYPKELKNKPGTERFEYKFKLLCALLEKAEREHNDFYWKYYVPYYTEMYDRSQLLTFSYIIHSAAIDDNVAKWIKTHKTNIDDFNDWSKTYEWYER